MLFDAPTLGNEPSTVGDELERLARTAVRPASPEEGLRAVASLRAELDRVEAENVNFALRAGWSWGRIAAALGVTKQAAHARHAHRARAAGLPRVNRGTLVVAGRARRAVRRARHEARALGHEATVPEHLLIALMQDEGSAAATALAASGLVVEQVREAVSPPAPVTGNGRPPLSEGACTALEQSLREAVRLGSARLDVEHLLLAVLRDEEVTRLTLRLGVSPRAIEERLTAA